MKRSNGDPSGSPCSVPNWLRALIPFETEAQQAACRLHDAEYARGGTEAQRLMADLRFGVNLLIAGMDARLVDAYVFSVRAHGASHWCGEASAGGVILSPPERHEGP